MKRKRYEFMKDMGDIHRARKRRRAQREEDHLLDEETAPWLGRLEKFQDGLEFRTKEFEALGTEIARGVAQGAGNIGIGILKEGTDLAIDLLVSMAILGLVEQPSVNTRRNGRRLRRRR